jgi:hypothetical protein
MIPFFMDTKVPAPIKVTLMGDDNDRLREVLERATADELQAAYSECRNRVIGACPWLKEITGTRPEEGNTTMIEKLGNNLCYYGSILHKDDEPSCGEMGGCWWIFDWRNISEESDGCYVTLPLCDGRSCPNSTIGDGHYVWFSATRSWEKCLSRPTRGIEIPRLFKSRRLFMRSYSC